MREFKKKILAILPISIGGRLTTNSIINGFIQNNCIVTVFDELFDKNLNEVISKDYDYILGYDFSGLKIKIDNTFYWDKSLTSYETFKNIHYLPHFVDFEIYKDLKTNPEFDLMFAGRLDTDYRLSFFEELITKLPELKIAWYAIDRHYQDAKNRAKYPELISLCYQGFIDNEEDMAKAINNCKIVFNMNSQGISSLNYRTFQTVACKRLLISDYREELALFDGHMPFYEDFSDLIFKIEAYLEDKEAYYKVTEECYKIAKQSHNSKDCVKYILKEISK